VSSFEARVARAEAYASEYDELRKGVAPDRWKASRDGYLKGLEAASERIAEAEALVARAQHQLEASTADAEASNAAVLRAQATVEAASRALDIAEEREQALSATVRRYEDACPPASGDYPRVTPDEWIPYLEGRIEWEQGRTPAAEALARRVAVAQTGGD